MYVFSKKSVLQESAKNKTCQKLLEPENCENYIEINSVSVFFCRCNLNLRSTNLYLRGYSPRVAPNRYCTYSLRV